MNIISAASSSYMYIVKAAKTYIRTKNCTFNVDEFDTRSNVYGGQQDQNWSQKYFIQTQNDLKS